MASSSKDCFSSRCCCLHHPTANSHRTPPRCCGLRPDAAESIRRNDGSFPLSASRRRRNTHHPQDRSTSLSDSNARLERTVPYSGDRSSGPSPLPEPVLSGPVERKCPWCCSEYGRALFLTPESD